MTLQQLQTKEQAVHMLLSHHRSAQCLSLNANILQKDGISQLITDIARRWYKPTGMEFGRQYLYLERDVKLFDIEQHVKSIASGCPVGRTIPHTACKNIFASGKGADQAGYAKLIGYRGTRMVCLLLTSGLLKSKG